MKAKAHCQGDHKNQRNHSSDNWRQWKIKKILWQNTPYINNP
jgi:hypothetical protein